ncbi:hypothetical protein [Enterococcus plantarum]|uniref:hypothetical protein n=1 Tax=Enterococcus plantarum TaxID=1077675 RepID=UPI001A8FB370|nr:hypothetical protein [Enterococcus plantarum]MBO0422696.1 hypothetical protein [Enterococcus plantarum]
MNRQKLIEKLEHVIQEVKRIPEGETIEVSNQFGDIVEEAEVLQDQKGKWFLELGEVCQDN